MIIILLSIIKLRNHTLGVIRFYTLVFLVFIFVMTHNIVVSMIVTGDERIKINSSYYFYRILSEKRT